MPDADQTPPAPGSHIGRTANGQFTTGWTGRPHWARNKRTEDIQALLAQYALDPIEARIAFCCDLRAEWQAQAFPSEYARMEHAKLYHACLADLTPYCYPKLKAIEHTVEPPIVAKLQALDGLSDDELKALAAEAHAYAQQLPPGR